MSTPFTCKFTTSKYRDLTPENIDKLAIKNDHEYDTVFTVDIGYFRDTPDEHIQDQCKGPASILVINFTEGEGTSEERLSKIMDNTNGAMLLMQHHKQLNTGLVIFNGRVPPALWRLSP